MTIQITVPEVSETALREAFGPELHRAALEALAIAAYRTGKISANDVGKLIGVENRCEIEQWLADRNVPLNYTIADLEADRRTLDNLLGPVRR